MYVHTWVTSHLCTTSCLDLVLCVRHDLAILRLHCTLQTHLTETLCARPKTFYTYDIASAAAIAIQCIEKMDKKLLSVCLGLECTGIRVDSTFTTVYGKKD